MDIKHITSNSLRRLLTLTEKKSQLLDAMTEIENEISKALGSAATTAVEVAEAVTPFKPKAGPKAGGRGGNLKGRILALLEAAGDEGLNVKDIAADLGVKGSNVSVWFSTTGKNLTHRLSPGHFALSGGTAPTKPVKPKPAKRTTKSISKPNKTTKTKKKA